MTPSRPPRSVLALAAAAAFVSVTGCAPKTAAARPPTSAATAASRVASTRPDDLKGELPLEQIAPVAKLPAPSTRPSNRPPSLEALQTYAQARAALVDNQRFKAIVLLQRVTTLDPDAFDPQLDLAKSYLVTGAGTGANDACVTAFEKAAALRPDELEVQYELGRQYLNQGDAGKAIERLHLAQLTTAYREEGDPELAVMTDFFFGRALAQSGYTAAASKQYEGLLDRLSKPGVVIHGQSDLAWLVHHPELIYAELGELYEKRGRPIDALQAYELALKSEAPNAELAARVVRLYLVVGQSEEAKKRTEKLVLDSHAGVDSLRLLKDVYRKLGDPTGPAKVLEKLHAEHASDRLLFYALLEELKATGRNEQAERLLVDASHGSNADPDYTRRLFALYQSRDDNDASMRLLVESLAARPDSLREIGPLWSELIKPSRGSRLRLTTLQAMHVPPAQEAARLFWVSRLADALNRDALARGTLLQAAALKPAFPPVYRWLIGDYWSRPDWDEKQKAEACEGLARICDAQRSPALAAELRGRSSLQQNDAAAAVKLFAAAEAAGGKSPDLRLMHARAIEQAGDTGHAEQILQRLVNDWPQYEEAYSELFNLYIQRRAGDQAVGVVRKWVEAVPGSVDGRLLEATIFNERGLLEEAQAVYDTLFAEQAANADVLKAEEEFYRRKGTIEPFVVKLEAERLRDPDNRPAVEALVSLYADQHRQGDALRVLDSARSAGAKDPDLLYYVAHLYERVEQKDTTEQLLQQVVSLDPRHAAANNDLGYTWADEGKNLDRAEALVRVAVEEEPDNQSYLDSMAWVEYKRGKFSEAKTFLDRAIGPANRPDPVVLDHLGDVLYRLHLPTDAVAQWRRSLHRIEESESARDDLKALRAQLQQKLKQQEQGHPVDVAPIAENVSGTSEHAKN